MSAQCRRGTGRVVAAHDHVIHRLRLLLARGEHQDALRGQDLVYAHRQRVLRHERGILERARIRGASALGQQRDVRGLLGLGVGLVERNVPVLAYAEDLDVRRMLLHRRGIPLALRRKIVRHAVRDVGVRGVDVYLGEEIVAHEPRKTRLVVRIHADVLVEVERTHALIARAVLLVIVRHLLVKRDGRIPGREPDHRVALCGKHLFDLQKRALAQLFPVSDNCDSHAHNPPPDNFTTLYARAQ